MGFIVTDFGQNRIGIRDDRGTFIRAHRTHHINGVCDFVGVGNHHFLRFFPSQILKFCQHLLGGAQIQRRLFIGILKTFSRHDDPSVNLVLRVEKMHITGGNHRFLELFSQLHNLPVKVLNIFLRLHRLHLFRCNHKFIVSHRLDFQIVIEIHQPRNLRVGGTVQQCPVQLSRLTGTAQKKSLPVFHKETLGHTGTPVVIGEMGLRNQPVQVHPPDVVLRQNDGVIGSHLLNDVRVGLPHGVDFCQSIRPLLQEHLAQFNENLRGTFRIVHRTMMIFQRNIQGLCHRIQSMFRLVGQKHPGNAHGIHIGNVGFDSLPSGIFQNKTHIKVGIVRHQNTALTKL